MIKMGDRKESALALFAPMWITGDEKKLGIKIYNLDQSTARDFLESHWGVTDREELIYQIDRMSIADGHMEEYMEEQKILLEMSEEEAQQYINRDDEGEQNDKLTIVNTYKYELMNCGGDAFDICRGQFLASMGFECGYITEKEAWQYILTTYDTFCDHFESWEQYLLSYNAGRQYWTGNVTSEYADTQMVDRNIPLFFEKNSLFKECV